MSEAQNTVEDRQYQEAIKAVENTLARLRGCPPEELGELQTEIKENRPENIEDEFGDVLFSMVNYARFLGVNPENALERTNKKFIKRFQYLESKAKEQGKKLGDMSLAEMDVFWNEAKLL